MGTKKRFISEVELAENYGIPRKTLQKWRLFGNGPVFRKFGTSVRYDVAEIENWIGSLPKGGGGKHIAA
jgi:predicted DNA-binding transcriptional regulator AlpA